MKQKGSMTVFFCLITVLITALIGTCLESARTAGVRFMAKTAVGSAMQSVFAEYHEELWDRYQVFFRHDTDGVREEIEEYLSYYTEPGKELVGLPEYTDFWGMTIDEVEITESKNMLSEGGRLFLEQAVEYEKYRVAANILEMFLDQVGILEELGKVRSFVKRIRDCLEIIQQINVLYQDVRDVMIDVKVGANVIKEMLEEESLSLTDLSIKAQQIRELFEHLSKSVSNYFETAETIQTLVAELKQEYGSEEGTIYGEQIGQMEMFTVVGDIGNAIFRLEDRLDSVCDQIAGLETEIKDWLDADDPSGDATEKAHEMTIQLRDLVESCHSMMQETEEVFVKYEAGDDYAGGLEEEEVEEWTAEGKSLLDRVVQWKNMAVLSLILGVDAGETKQNVISDAAGLPSKQMSEDLIDVSIEEKAMFAFYIGEVFTCWTSEVQRDFAYQQEYILFRKEDSRGNLAAMAETLLAVREALNLVYLLTNEEMRLITESIAYSLVGATGLYPIVVIVQFVLMTAWAFAESVSDVKSLFRGEKVPIWKNEGNWQTSLGGIVAVPESGISPVGLSESGLALSYNDYLRIFLFLNRTEKLCAASLDMIQEDIGRFEPGFSVSDCYGKAVARVQVSSAYRLITMPLVGILPEGRHRLIVETGYQYK